MTVACNISNSVIHSLIYKKIQWHTDLLLWVPDECSGVSLQILMQDAGEQNDLPDGRRNLAVASRI